MRTQALLALAAAAALALPAHAQRSAQPFTDDAFARALAAQKTGAVPPIGEYRQEPIQSGLEVPAEPAGKQEKQEEPDAPEISLKDLNGKQVKLSSYKGKVVLLDFFAVWCGPCQKSTPFLVEMYKKYAKEGFIVLGIEKGSATADVEAYAKKAGITFPVLPDLELKAYKDYGVNAVPTFGMVDRKGKVVWARVGFSDTMKTDFEAKIAELLQAK